MVATLPSELKLTVAGESDCIWNKFVAFWFICDLRSVPRVSCLLPFVMNKSVQGNRGGFIAFSLSLFFMKHAGHWVEGGRSNK